MTKSEMPPWLGNCVDVFWNVGIASTWHFVQSVIQSDVKNVHNSYLDITVQVGVVGLAVALGFLLLFFWRAAALVKFDRAPIAALPMFFLAFIMAYSLSEYALFRQHSLIQLLLGLLYVSAALALPSPLPRPIRPHASPPRLPAPPLH